MEFSDFLRSEVAHSNLLTRDIGTDKFNIDADRRARGKRKQGDIARMCDIEIQGLICRRGGKERFAAGFIGELQFGRQAMQVAAEKLAKNTAGSDVRVAVAIEEEFSSAGAFFKAQGGGERLEEGVGRIEGNAPNVDFRGRDEKITPRIRGPIVSGVQVVRRGHDESLMHCGDGADKA